MNDAQVAIIKQTVPVLQEHGETLTRRFYENMFSNNPEVKRFFNPAHQHSGTQQRALAGAICAYAANIDNPAALAGAVDLIAHKHVSLGIEPAHYPIVGNNLILTIKEILGEAANDDVIDAWTAAYGQLVAIFVAHEKNLYDKQNQRFGWQGFKAFSVVKTQPESANITSFYLQPKDGKPLPGQRPGQYITVRLTIDGNTVMRNYSLSNAPSAGYFRISVKRETGLNSQTPDGLVSNYLHDHLKQGDSLDLAPPSGEFTLDVQDVSANPLVFIAGGVGITPIMAMSHAALANEHLHKRPIYLFQAARNADMLPFEDELAAIAEQHSNFNWQIYLSQQSQPVLPAKTNLHHGRFSLAALDSLIDRQQPVTIYACGPAALIKDIAGMLKIRDQASDKFYYEFFGPAQAIL